MKKILVIIIILVALFAEKAIAQTNHPDYAALMAIYNATGGANWTNKTNWGTNNPIDTWYGVYTYGSGRVRQLALGSNNLIGVLPPELINLTNLTDLYLFGNGITGLPSQIGNLTNLEYLNVGLNELISIPSSVGNLTKLKWLNLRANQINSIPTEIGNLINLEQLYLDRNNGINVIPTQIGNLVKLEVLDLSFTAISSIPSEIGNLTQLQDLFIQSTQITSLPTQIGNLVNLISLYASLSKINSLPSSIGNLTKLTTLTLHYNELASIPNEIGNLVNLTTLNLWSNRLTNLPNTIGNLNKLTYLNLSSNQLTSLPASIGNLGSLQSLDLSYNQLTSLPNEMSNMTNLDYLYLTSNQLTSLPNISGLLGVYLYYNQFTFEDIYPYRNVPNKYYTPQNSNIIGVAQTIKKELGSSNTLTALDITTNNVYKWFKNGVEISGANSATYTINSIQNSDFGTYTYRITNTDLPNLTFDSAPITLQLEQCNITIPNITVSDPSVQIRSVKVLSEGARRLLSTINGVLAGEAKGCDDGNSWVKIAQLPAKSGMVAGELEPYTCFDNIGKTTVGVGYFYGYDGISDGYGYNINFMWTTNAGAYNYYGLCTPGANPNNYAPENLASCGNLHYYYVYYQMPSGKKLWQTSSIDLVPSFTEILTGNDAWYDFSPSNLPFKFKFADGNFEIGSMAGVGDNDYTAMKRLRWKTPGRVLKVSSLPVTLTAQDGYQTYKWSNGETTRAITITTPGYYTVTVSNGNSCYVTSTDIVEVAEEKIYPLATLTHIDAPCPLTCPDNYAEGKIALAVSPELPVGQSYTYTWSQYNSTTNAYDQLVPTTATLENLKIGTYKVVVKNTTTNKEISRIYQVNRPLKWAADDASVQSKAKNVSTQAGDWIEFATNTDSQNNYWVGLNTDNTIATAPENMNYAVKIVGNSSNTSTLGIYESPVPNSPALFQTPLLKGDVVGIKRTSQAIEYYINGTKLSYSSNLGTNSNLPLYVRGFTQQGGLPIAGTNFCAPCNGDDNYNYVRSYVYNKPIKTEAEANCLSPKYRDEVQISTEYFDGLGRPIQSIAHNASPSQGDIIMPVAYDEFGRQTKTYSPYTVKADECARFRPEALIEQALFYKENATDTELTAKGVSKETNMAKTTHPFAQTDFEASPLNRVLRQGAVGGEWQLKDGYGAWNPALAPNGLPNDHAVKSFSRTNNSVESPSALVPADLQAVRRWIRSNGTWNGNQVYALSATTGEGQLMVTETLDEHNKKVIEYRNKEGQTILKRVETGEASPKNWADTYYLYDDFGRQLIVIQPEGVQALATILTNKWIFREYAESAEGNGINRSIRDNFMFQYSYDERGRMMGKHIPGTAAATNVTTPTTRNGWEWIVYDRRDRVVLSKSLRSAQEWVYTKYDFLNRPIYQGVCFFSDASNNAPSSVGRLRRQAYAPTPYFEDKTTANTIGYTSGKTFPKFDNGIATAPMVIAADKPHQMLSINFYDSYDLDNDGTRDIAYPQDELWKSGDQPLADRGRLVVSRTTNTISNNEGHTVFAYLQSVNFYDKYGRIAQTQADNHVGGKEVSTTQYDFAGKVTKTRLQHRLVGSNAKYKVAQFFDYDHQGRLLYVYQQIDQQEKILMLQNTYNEVGQLIDKTLHSLDEGNTNLQEIAYQYHVRGWLKKINNFETNNNKLFSFQLAYETNDNGIAGFFPQYNGNIASTVWRTENAANPTSGQQRSYTYTYDAMNRLTAATYLNANKANEKYSLTGMGYDLNGNITAMSQEGANSVDANGLVTAYGIIDQLSYNYATGIGTGTSNRLVKVSEAANIGQGIAGDFKKASVIAGSEYLYNEAGSLIADYNKRLKVNSYTYNQLPQEIIFYTDEALTAEKGRIYFRRDASGRKLRKEVRTQGGGTIAITDYVGSFTYQYTIPTATPTTGGTSFQFLSTTAPEVDFMQAAEGRIVGGLPTPPSWGGAGGGAIPFGHPDSYEYSYKDHLGNLRLSYRPQTASESTEVLNFETANPKFTHNATLAAGYLSPNSGSIVQGQKITYTKFPVPAGTIVKAKVFATWASAPTNTPVLPAMPNVPVLTSPVVAMSPTGSGEVIIPAQINLSGLQTLSTYTLQRPSKAPQTPP
ncbi:MAG: leucine-rich repeat domain-containing protein, partial [Cytophagales bacterium]